jgi:hypothetical protein
MRKIALVVAGVCLSATMALGADGEPAKAGKYQATAINASGSCTTPTETTAGVLALPACPATDGPLCTFGVKGKGKLAAKAKTDVALQAQLGGLESCVDGTVLQLTADIRVNTNNCTISPRCTTVALPGFAVPGATCTVSGGKCKIKTTVNTLIPGAITVGDNTSIEVDGVGLTTGTVAVAAAGVLVP